MHAVVIVSLQGVHTAGAERTPLGISLHGALVAAVISGPVCEVRSNSTCRVLILHLSYVTVSVYSVNAALRYVMVFETIDNDQTHTHKRYKDNLKVRCM